MNKEPLKQMNMRMKHIIAAALAMIGVVASAQQEVCHIRGQVLNDSLRYEGRRLTKIYLSGLDEHDRLYAVDSTLVSDGRFEFSHRLKQEEPLLMYFLTGFDNGQVALFLEPGTVDVKIRHAAYPGGAKVVGTATNDLYAEYKALSARCVQAQIDSLKVMAQRRGEDWHHTPEGIAERSRIGAAELFECTAERLEFLLKHAHSPLAPLMMEKEMAYMFDKRYTERLLKSLPPTLHKHPYYLSFYNSVRAQDLRVGGDLPNIKIPLRDGTHAMLNDFRGKYVLLDFWASWCAPCLKEIPSLITLYNEAHEKNADFVIVSFSLDNKEKAWKEAIAAKGIDLPGWVHGSDLLGWGSPAARLMGVTAIPKTVLIDPEGKAISFSLRGEEMVRRIRQILNGDKYYLSE